MSNQNDGTYSFSSNPRAVDAVRKPYREPEDVVPPPATNLMFDPRVRRGGTYGATVRKETTGVGTTGSLSKTRTKRLRPMKKTVFDVKPKSKARQELSLDDFLIEQKDEVVETAVTTQTDDFVERPETPPYVPKKTGIDAATQIEGEDHLFDFDEEVEPLLEVIVGKILEQSMLELQQELELARLDRRVTKLGADKTNEATRVEGMEEAEIKKHQDKLRLVARERARLAREHQATAKVVAVDFGSRLAASALAGAMAFADRQGLFKDPVKEEIETAFMPGLYKRVQARLATTAATHACIDDLIKASLQRGIAQYEQRLADDAAAAEAERKRLAELEKKKFMRVFVKLAVPDAEDTMVGPVVVRRVDTVGEAEAKIRQWLADNPKPETEVLLADESKTLRLCSGGTPLDSESSLLEAVGKSTAPLELLPVGGEDAEEDED